MSRDGRFAPSPTGTLHLGNLRTALLAWLFARSAGASFILRMEDLDYGRVRAGAAARQLEDLAALGLDWDGDVVFQSSRVSAYAAALERLRAEGHVYECFCTRAEIRAAASAPHGPLPEGAYPGTCLRLTEGERRRKRGGGRPPALRVHADGARVGFTDRLRGPQAGVVDDFVVLRNDGAPAYNLAVVVDDADQGIEEVVRGDDLLPATAAQAHLCDLLGIPRPAWAHVPLVLGPDGARLAKRHGAVTLADLREDGLTAADAVVWIARTLELAAPAEQVTAADLLARFDPGRLPAEPTTFTAIRS
jgi:glutamyl-tRNA synthetase